MSQSPMDEIAAADLAYVRLLITDTSDDPETQIFSDEELTTLLLANSGPLLAAADALEMIAVSELLLSKKITTQDLSTDGPSVAKELRAQAASLRKRAKDKIIAVTEEAWGFTAFSMNPINRAPEATEYPRRWL